MRQIALETWELKKFGELHSPYASELSGKPGGQDDDDRYSYTGLGWEYMDKQQYGQAAKAFLNAVQVSKDYEAYNDLSLAYRRMGKMEQALRYCDKAFEFIVSSACWRVADSAESQQDGWRGDKLSKFLSSVYNLLMHDSNYSCICSNKGYILLALGRDIEARQMFLEEKACGQFLEFLSDNDEESE